MILAERRRQRAEIGNFAAPETDLFVSEGLFVHPEIQLEGPRMDESDALI